jgi:hypothetical protein
LSKSYQSSRMALFNGDLSTELLAIAASSSVPLEKEEAYTFAASSASLEEQAKSALKDGVFPDGSKPVEVERRIWRAPVKSQYVEPEMELDPSEELDYMFVNAGKTVLKSKKILEPRDDIIVFSPERHQHVFEKLIQWRDCPVEHRPVIEAIINDFWDVFDPSGALRPIRRYLFNIDTGNHPPVCCKPPRYGPHESKVMNKLLDTLESKGVIEDDYGPYGAMIVLASKPNQDHVHWTEYVFRLCVSYRMLNAVTRPFQYPIPRCDDEAERMGSNEWAISSDADQGYWQVAMHKSAKDKTGFFTPDGKKHFCHLPMGIRNASPFYCCMNDDFRKQVKEAFFGTHIGVTLIKEIQEKYRALSPNAFSGGELSLHPEALLKKDNPGSAIIIDDILTHAKHPIVLLAYFVTFLQVFELHRVSLKLRKTRFLPSSAEFVGMDLKAEGNAPASSKYGAIKKLSRPRTFGDLHMLIGLFVWYHPWIPWFEDRVAPWRNILKKKPPVDTPKPEEAKLMESLWKPQHNALLEEFKLSILSGPVLKRPDWDRPFYVKTDWSSRAKGGVLCQPDCSPEAEVAIKRELEGADSEFDKTISGLRLRPLRFISKVNTASEQHHHSSVGELATGRWAFLKWNKYLWYRPFIWITDCSGIIKFWNFDLMPNHQLQRWKVDMLRFDFTAVHRPENMLCECNLLSRYNQHGDELRDKERPAVVERDQTIERRLSSGANPNKRLKITKLQETEGKASASSLLATQVPLVSPFSGRTWHFMGCEFRRYLEAYDNRPGFSNEKVTVRGPDTVNRSFLADAHDPGRIVMTVMPAGVNLMQTAMSELNMEPKVLLQGATMPEWVEHTNMPDITKMIGMLESSKLDLQVDWLWMDLTDSKVDNDVAFGLIALLKSRGARAVILSWSLPEGMGSSPSSTVHQTYLEQRNSWEEWIGEAFTDWVPVLREVQNTHCGGPIRRATLLLLAVPKFVADKLSNMNGQDEPEPMEPYLDLPNTKYSDYLHGWAPGPRTQEAVDSPYDCNISQSVSTSDGPCLVFDRMHPAPDLLLGRHGSEEVPYFLIEARDMDSPSAVRSIRDWEIIQLFGFPKEFDKEMVQLNTRQKTSLLCHTIPKHTLQRVMSVLQMAEEDAKEEEMGWIVDEVERNPSFLSYYCNSDTDGPVGMVPFAYATAKVINRWTTFPMPTLKEWQEQTKADPDLCYIVSRMEQGKPISLPALHDRRYYKEWAKRHLEVEDGILYQWEHPKIAAIRQLRRRVVPIGMRQLVYTAYHASPMAGHVGFYKTYWRIAARYFWPGMHSDIKKAVTECGHCVLGNNVSHQAQQILGRLSVDEPFDVIAIDIWVPGVTDKKGSYIADRTNIRKAAITSLCNLVSFATVGFLENMESEIITKVIMSQIILPNGLPKLVLLDEDSLFKNDLRLVLDDLGIAFHIVSAEQHEGILCERFHRYLNKVQRIAGLDTKDHSNWMMNTSFAAYAWNASPVDGTDVIRSFAAKARTFHFPLDVQEEPPRVIGSAGERTLQHIETVFPLWFQQKEILRLLVMERREKHTQWANRSKTRREFCPGDIVVVRRQVTSDASAGRPAKLRMRARGPYRVLEKAGEDSYWIQRIPALQELNRKPGVRQKQAAWRLERIPSGVVIHKRIDSADTRWVQQQSTLQDNPLEHNLGFFDFGKYHKAANDEKYAFDKAEDLLDIEVDWEENDEEEDENENDDLEIGTDTPSASDSKSDKDAQPSGSDNLNHQPVRGPGQPYPLQVQRPQGIDSSRPLSSVELKKKLAREVSQSKDKLFLIFRQRPSHKQNSWHLVQVDEEETNRTLARREGIYHVRFYVRCLSDSRKKKVKECAYWPEIHEFKRDGVTVGPMVPTKPGKVEALLEKKPFRYMWYQDSVNLFETMLSGPFDFVDGYKVPQEAWKQLLEKAPGSNVYTGALNRVIPLDKPDPQDKDNKGNPTSFFAFRWSAYGEGECYYV